NSQGGVMDAEDMAEAPIHSINSGPSMAPVAGRHFALRDAAADVAIVADTGGTSYDVSLVRRGRIPWTRETWLGEPFFGHMTGFPSVDVKSIGAGGGSIASVDEGGLLHVGPESAGSVPGPVLYGRGGGRPPTVRGPRSGRRWPRRSDWESTKRPPRFSGSRPSTWCGRSRRSPCTRGSIRARPCSSAAAVRPA